eukprot:10691654-Alexandrium_andersonii.AAC.1
MCIRDSAKATNQMAPPRGTRPKCPTPTFDCSCSPRPGPQRRVRRSRVAAPNGPKPTLSNK